MKNLLLSFVFLHFVSCSSTSYFKENPHQRMGVDFTRGNWVLSKIDCPTSVYDKLNEKVCEDFVDNLNERFYKPEQINTSFLLTKIPINPDKKIIADLSKNTIFDYVINIKAEKIKNELGTISVTNHKYNKHLKNKVSVTLEIYDLKALEIIYSQKYTATTTIGNNNNSDINFTKSTDAVIISAYKKLMRDINKKSIKSKL